MASPFLLKNGVGDLGLEEPRVVRLDYKVIWKKIKIDLKELANLRESGLSFREIAKTPGPLKEIWKPNLL